MSKNNVPAIAHMSNYASSAMVSVPLNELDVLRADLMRANAKVIELEKNERQVKVTLKKKLVREFTDYSEVDWAGDAKIKKETKWLEEAIFVNMSEVKDILNAEYNARLDTIEAVLTTKANNRINDEINKCTKYKQDIDLETAGLRKELHTKYNADSILLLEGEIDNLTDKLSDSKSKLSEAKDANIILTNKIKVQQTHIEKLSPSVDALNNIKYLFDKGKTLHIADKFLQRYYKKIDNLLKTTFDE